jgi:Xaa-Pro aminopeptidase
MSTRRDFIKTSGAFTLGAALGTACSPEAQEGGAATSTGNSASMLVKNPDHPQPATYDRLPLEWYQNNVKRLQQKLGEQGLDGILMQNRWDIIYFTGLFHTTTERPFSCFIPTDEMAVYWFTPGLDLELVKSWWYTGGDYYYDYYHTEGGFPRDGKVVMGPPVDLLEWTLKGIEKQGYGDKKIGLSQPPTVEALKRMQEVLPKASFKRVDDICIKMRRVKTPEEIALIQRSMDYFSQIHAFGRDYILEHGTDVTDFQVKLACMEYGTDLVMRDIKRDGHPHTAVGIAVSIGCRTGIGTAYPHPNQFHLNKIKKGDSIQIAGVVRIGGYGGELYSPFQIEPWPEGGEKMWEVMAEGSRMQIEMSKAGVRCQEIAKAVHDMQVKNNMQPYLYQRVAHGEGMEGHQEPWIALGDPTVLEEGMTFSMEPGLFNPEGGYGYNPSDNILVTKDKGVAQGSVPNLDKEWALLKL